MLVAQNVLSAEQADKVRRAQKSVSASPPSRRSMQLGVATDAQIAQALAAHCGLPYVKINPLDLDLDVVTKSIADPFARSNGIVAIDIDKNARPHHDRGARPVRPTPWIDEIKRVTKSTST